MPAMLLPCALLACLAVLPPCGPDELRLADGRVLVGRVELRGDVYEVTTADGVLRVPKAEVTAHLDEDTLRRRHLATAREAGDTPFAQLHLAIQARDHGLEPELWRHLDRAVAGLDAAAQAPADSDAAAAHAALQRRLRDFLGQLEPLVLPRKWRTAPVGKRVQALLDQLRADTGPGRTAALEELLVREANADQDLRQAARRHGSPRVRLLALAALQRRGTTGNDRFVWRSTILDQSAEVRREAAALGRAGDAAAAVSYLAPGLEHADPRVRVRTAEAFAGFGHPAAVPLLVAAGPNAGRALAARADADRGHIAVLQQQAYIRDFDVEIASAAFIADPKIDVLQSGAVLDVTVIGVEITRIVRAYRAALRDLAGRDPGEDPRHWAAWLASAPAAPARPATTGAGR